MRGQVRLNAGDEKKSGRRNESPIWLSCRIGGPKESLWSVNTTMIVYIGCQRRSPFQLTAATKLGPIEFRGPEVFVLIVVRVTGRAARSAYLADDADDADDDNKLHCGRKWSSSWSWWLLGDDEDDN